MAPAKDVSKRLKLSLIEVQSIVESVCKDLAQRTCRFERLELEGNDRFTSGDPALDEAFGGGIRTGMVWDLVGERCVTLCQPIHRYLSFI